MTDIEEVSDDTAEDEASDDLLLADLQQRMKAEQRRGFPPKLEHLAIAIALLRDPALVPTTVCKEATPPITSSGTRSRILGYRDRILEYVRCEQLSIERNPEPLIVLPLDVAPFGLSPNLLLHPDWLALHTPEFKRLTASDLQIKVAGEQACRDLDGWLEDSYLPEYTCGMRHYLPDEDGGCNQPMRRMRLHGDADVTAEIAAWNGEADEKTKERMDLWYDDLDQWLGRREGEEGSGQNDPSATEMFCLSYHGGSVYEDRPLHFGCNGHCDEAIPDVAVRWRCEACEWDYCLNCADLVHFNFCFRSTNIVYDLPPASGECASDRKKRRKRHRMREEAASQRIRPRANRSK